MEYFNMEYGDDTVISDLSLIVKPKSKVRKSKSQSKDLG